jgi:hypothetical protein
MYQPFAAAERSDVFLSIATSSLPAFERTG